MDAIHVSIKAGVLTHWFGIPITNTLLMSWVVVIVLVTFAFIMRSKLKLIPSKMQLLMEILLEQILQFMENTLESKVLAMRYFPLIVSLFLFIFIANLFEFIPGIGSIGVLANEVNEAAGEHGTGFTPLLKSMNTDLNVTLALSLISFLVIEISGIVMVGFFRYFSRFFNFQSPIMFFVGIIEFVSELIRLISFSFRLFGNIFAGEVLLSVVVFFVPFIMPVPFMAFEVFVGFMQAAIFSLLTLFFLKLAVTEVTH